MRYILSVFLSVVLLAAGCARQPRYWKGADIGWATEYESKGLGFYNSDGEPRECTALMKELGLGAFDSEGRPTVIMDGFTEN